MNTKSNVSFIVCKQILWDHSDSMAWLRLELEEGRTADLERVERAE